jgi:hypothetical protein
VEFAAHGARLRLGGPSVGALPGRVTWNPSGVAIEIGLPGGAIEAHLDTGANLSELNESALGLLSAAQRASLTTRRIQVEGVSGALERDVSELPMFEAGLAGAFCRVERIAFGDETGDAQGRVGIDLVRACEAFALDFPTMSFAAR